MSEMMIANGCEEARRLPYTALKSEGQYACVIGPNNEIVVECPDGDDRQQWAVATSAAAMLNDQDLNHSCSDKGRRIRAQHLLLLVRQNVVRDLDAMEMLACAIDEAGVSFAQAEIAELTGANTPF